MSKTLENLAKAFVGESQARNRYTFWAKAAEKEGLLVVAEAFSTIAEQERVHAATLYKMMTSIGGKNISLKVETDVAVSFGTTAENLRAAIGGESHEFESMYPEFADIAQSEGHGEIAARLRGIAQSENYHQRVFAKLLKSIEEGTMFKGGADTHWVCAKCGYAHTGANPPAKCPSCDHPEKYFSKKHM